MSGEGKVVCVTGASGYIASWLVKLLLERGYTVNATLRDPNDPKKTEGLYKLGAKERLRLFKADLLEQGSFDSAVEGCEGVFHTASPVVFSTTNPQVDLIDPAVKGTLNVLKSCAKVVSLKRVILTSSTASVLVTGKPLTPDVVVDETWFSDPAFCEKKESWYVLSKTLAEEAAWKFANENGIDLVAVNPGVVMGPILFPTTCLSVDEILNLIINGTMKFLGDSNGFVDVRDVAQAHVQGFEIPAAAGRYCLVENVTHNSEILKILHQLFPTLPLHEKCEDDNSQKLSFQVSKEKAKGLGLSFIPLEVSLKDTVESLKENGFLNF